MTGLLAVADAPGATPARGRGGARRIGFGLVVPAVAALAVGLGLARRQPLSWDEAVTVDVATRPLRQMAGTLSHSDAVLGLYYLLVHGWASVLDTVGIRPTEVWWRLPSAVAAVVTCVVVASCARRLAGPAAGVVAGCFLAVCPLFSFYAVDARPYTLAASVVVSAWWIWTRPAGPRAWWGTAATCTLLVVGAWLQLFSVLVWPAFLLVRGRSGFRRSLTMLTVAAAGVVPVLAVALTQSGEIGWIPPASPANTGRVALHVGGGIAVVAAVAVLAVVAARSGRLRRGPMTFAALWWSAAPLTLLAALDLVRPVLVARYALVSLPLAAVGFAVVVVRAGRGRAGAVIRVAAVAAVVAAVVTSTWQGTRPWKYEDYRGAAAYVTTTVAQGTPVLFSPSSARLGFDLYARHASLTDVALPAAGGVGDPLAIPELPPATVRANIGDACTVVVVGDPLTSGSRSRSATDRSTVGTVWDWTAVRGQRFGQVTVTVLHDPGCLTATAARG